MDEDVHVSVVVVPNVSRVVCSSALSTDKMGVVVGGGAWSKDFGGAKWSDIGIV